MSDRSSARRRAVRESVENAHGIEVEPVVDKPKAPGTARLVALGDLLIEARFGADRTRGDSTPRFARP